MRVRCVVASFETRRIQAGIDSPQPEQTMSNLTFVLRDAPRSVVFRRSRGQPARHPAAADAPYRYDRRNAALPRRRSSSPNAAPDPVTLAAATWLACGIVLLGLTPLPLRDATLGWSPAFWLLVAPAILLLARYMFREQSSLHSEQPW
jgi:hypothetical protein